MNEATPAQWVADPYGRHQLRYWDGAAWTEHVVDDNRPGRDPLVASPVNAPQTTARAGSAPWAVGDLGRTSAAQPGHGRASAAVGAPARAGEPAPLMSGKAHAGVGLLTCGLWLLVAPVIYWIRKGSYKHAAVWAAAWALVILIGNLTGGAPADTVSTAAQSPASTGTAQGLLGGNTSDSSGAPPASTTSSSASSAARPTTKATTKPTALATTQVPAVKPKTTKPRTTTPSRRPSTTKKTTSAPKTDPRYGTCKAAKAAGYGPYYRGQDPEYYWYRDADGDGIVCE